MTRSARTWWCSQCHKLSHDEPEHAEAQIVRVQVHGRWGSATLSVYACPYGEGWHIGRS